MSSVENGMLQREELRKIDKDMRTKVMEITTIKKMINIKCYDPWACGVRRNGRVR